VFSQAGKKKETEILSKDQPHNALNNEKQMMFEQIHNWARFGTNAAWLMTSFFIFLNFFAIKIVLSDLGRCYVESHFADLRGSIRIILTFVIFAVLWLIPSLCILTTLVIARRLSFLIRNSTKSDFGQRPDLSEALGFRWADLKKILVEAIIAPYGWVILGFTILFLGMWIWIFFYFIP